MGKLYIYLLHGGVALLVILAIPHSRISHNTGLQAIAARITLHQTITVCSIYFPPSLKFNSSDLDDLISHLPPPILLLGDFNAHSTVWGSSKTNIRGKQIEDLFQKQNLCLLNDGSSTYMHAATASTSAIDLSICSPTIFRTYGGIFIMTSVEAITTQSEYLTTLLMLHMQLQVGNCAKQTGIGLAPSARAASLSLFVGTSTVPVVALRSSGQILK